MNFKTTSDWWMWQMYRQVAQFIHNPCEHSEARLMGLMAEYRARCRGSGPCRNTGDEHEWAMDFR